MAAYTSADLLADGKERYDENELRVRIAFGRTLTEAASDAELLEIAQSVYARVRSAAQASVSWPLPGTDDDGNAYADVWPRNVFQHALELFNWRTISGSLSVSEEQRRIGMAAEKFFDDLEKGLIGWGIGGITDLTVSPVLAARNRDGSSNLSSVSDRTRPTMLDAFRGGAWDWVP
jgi:hypothetical protein